MCNSYIGHLKSYVSNKAQLEGSIDEGYLVEEILYFVQGIWAILRQDGINLVVNREDDEPNDI